MKRKWLLVSIFLVTVISGCTNKTNDGVQINALKAQVKEQQKVIHELKQENEKLTKKMSEQHVNKDVLHTALDVVTALQAKDMKKVATYVHPEKGVRFSPYGHVNPDSDVVFKKTELPSLMESKHIYHFGTFDGSGQPIDMTFQDYFHKFVYDVDFANPHIIGNNVVIGKGNTIENIHDVYPNAVFVEFHFTGFDKQYNGMDWRSLRLVLEKQGETWYLVGIVHDQWTI
ncbi:hypothetical protein [Anoxybacteroides amylolyticum]|uniref:Lipoprotein n=1 Tax=Anoxybacteroides amylolyticum TaxID=294699 RepID=A0A161HTT9_9BACL|nr:hypothetical protein [Anoxybacillus amylolyticus]ANB59430.1 hypothetical protein GFC30_786 [Anoxybacillus amylolyticus]